MGKFRLGFSEYLQDLRLRLGNRCYSQEGEDCILARYFSEQSTGFFVDVGAHHPFRFSNTYLLYRRGWRGINVDATPGSMERFKRYRPHDINIEAGVGLRAGSATYYIFNEPALNTFDGKLAAERKLPYKVIRKVELPVLPLSQILARALPSGRTIDLLTVDVEGRDLEVLQSNDWDRFRPRIVLAETLDRRLMDLATEPITMFLESLGYVIAARTFNTTFMIDGAER